MLVRKGYEIGKKPFTANFIFHACKNCGIKRWVKVTFGIPCNLYCLACSNIRKGKILGLSNIGRKHTETTIAKIRAINIGDKSARWKGGICLTKKYRQVKIYPNSPYHPMANKQNYVLEHRLIMAKHLGRCLNVPEIIHHRNENTIDNRIENLELTTRSIHINIHRT